MSIFITGDLHGDFKRFKKRNFPFECWFFGHCHDNGVVRKRYALLYEQIVDLGS